MRNIIIVSINSTGHNLVEDVVNRNYHPILLEPKTDLTEEEARKNHEHYYSLPPYPFDIIQECDKYEDTLEMVRKLDPAVIIPGSEPGVALATRLGDDLSLKGNPASLLPNMTEKGKMHEALKKAGLRYMKGKEVSSVEEAEEFCRENNITAAVVKPIVGAGSNNVTLCDNLDDMRAAVESVLNNRNVFGTQIAKCLVQERIFGEEYIVNTTTCKGITRVMSVMRSVKTRTKEGWNIYDYIECIDELDPVSGKLIEYALDTAKAIGVRYGAIHGEYLVDEKGPVLIEVNCRPVGVCQPAGYLDLIFGQHETDSILDSYLNPDKFLIDAKKPYRPLRKAYMKFIKVPEYIESESLPIWSIVKYLPSVYLVSASSADAVQTFEKTRDLQNNGGVIYLVHDDKNVVNRDMYTICAIEKCYFNYLIDDGLSRRRVPSSESAKYSIREILENTTYGGSTLVIADKKYEIENVLCVTGDETDKVRGGFENVVIALEDSLCAMTENELIDKIFALLKFVRPAGHVIIPESTYRYFTSEREGAVLMLRVAGFLAEMPNHLTRDIVIGTRER